jgi:hypothetical protein
LIKALFPGVNKVLHQILKQLKFRKSKLYMKELHTPHEEEFIRGRYLERE